MQIDEIIVNPPRDEYLDSHSFVLQGAEPVARVLGLTLKAAKSPTEIHYGLYDRQDRIAGLLSLDYMGKDRWQVVLVQLAQAYKGLGLGTFLYDYAVMNDKLTLVADSTNTSGPHGSRKMWERIWQNSRYPVKGIDLKTQEIFNATPEQIYINDPNIRWIALPESAKINEAIQAIQSTMKQRSVVWYGPGTTTEDYFNW